MRSYVISLFLGLVYIVVITWSIGFISDNINMRENKNESWKEYLYLGSNKGYTRTVGFDSSKVSMKDLYTNIMPNSVGYKSDAFYYEALKDIADNSLYGKDIYFRIYLQENRGKPTFYIVRRVGENTNVMKVELKEGK